MVWSMKWCRLIQKEVRSALLTFSIGNEMFIYIENCSESITNISTSWCEKSENGASVVSVGNTHWIHRKWSSWYVVPLPFISHSYSKCSTNSFCFVCPVAEIPERLGWTADTDKVEGNDYELFDVVDEKFYKREYFEYVAGCIMPHALFPDIEE